MLNGLTQNSPLRLAIQTQKEKEKSNAGNVGARGHTGEELDAYNAEFRTITNQPLGTPFYIRINTRLVDPVNIASNHPIYSTFTEEGLKGRLQKDEVRKGTTKAKTAARPSLHSIFCLHLFPFYAQRIVIYDFATYNSLSTSTYLGANHRSLQSTKTPQADFTGRLPSMIFSMALRGTS